MSCQVVLIGKTGFVRPGQVTYRMTTNIGETNIWRFAIKLQLAKF